ncbi:unnamed protein product [Paramecium octaurelia]|uniref:F-box domain-containing protein n=1 Tax=Paramecium octaurelia TaxID=43137 RepID=A0A8S1XQL6_PAROT|nr:unnamed protein product [Paramecium octaurelia]
MFQTPTNELNNNDPVSARHNMLYQVEIEVFNQILMFLDIKSLLQFRLVSRHAKETVTQMLPIQLHNLQQLIEEQQNEIQIKIQSLQQPAGKDQNQDQGLQAALNGIQKINKAHINELKCFVRPPELVERIINLICLTLEPTFKIQKDNWKECLKFLNQQNFILLIINLDISKLSENQLQQLEQVKSIQEKQAAATSLVANSFLIYLKALLALRQSKDYETQIEIKELQCKTKKEKHLADKLEKIINK